MGNKLKTVDAETLLSTPMSKTMFIVDGFISQGVNVISGASKICKSWLMLWLGLQVAQGNSIWGLPTLQCDVLYLSLEDTQRRIKDRLYNLTDSAPDNLYFAVTSGLIGGGLEEQITDFLTEHLTPSITSPPVSVSCRPRRPIIPGLLSPICFWTNLCRIPTSSSRKSALWT